MHVLPRKSKKQKQSNSDIIGLDDKAVLAFVEQHVKDIENDHKIILSVDNRFSIDNLPQPAYHEGYAGIVNLRKANDIFRLTNVLSGIHNQLELGGKTITCVETAELRKKRLYKKFPAGFSTIYYIFDYLGKRVAPKLPVIGNVYYFLTAGRNRVLTSVEVLGRLAYCGFKILETQQINGLLFIVSEKHSHTVDVKPKNHGFLFKMNRVGYRGEIIQVYKIRTMYAYSEYLQEHVYQHNKLDKGGKFKDDYRVNMMGNIMRKLWLDELPMFYNLLKGEVKFIGVRPLSKQYLSLYTEEARQRRRNFKPGLIPPYYADLPETIDEIIESEMNYFSAYEKNPLRTDLKYFGKALKNIIFKKARSN